MRSKTINYKKISYLYLVAILSSGLFFAYATTRLISSNLASPFLILLMSTVIDIIVFFDLTWFQKLSQLPTRYLSLATVIFLLISNFFLFTSEKELFILIILYTFCTLSFSLHLLSFEQNIIGFKGNAKSGLISITLFKNISKIIGFSVGAILHNVSLQNYNLILLTSFLVLTTVSLQPEPKKVKVEKKSGRVKGKIYLFILILLGTTAVFWIPLFIVELKKKGILEYSSIVFMLPGIVSVLYLRFFQNITFKNSFMGKIILYIFIILSFLILNIYGDYLFVQVILFSILVAIGISISIEVRATFIRINKGINTKLSLQILNLISAVSLLCFTLLAMYLHGIQYLILILNMLAAIIILVYRKDFINENRTLL
ncbi:hypothetical protein A374_06886 [Fictibacillus macauensis ZFHKF-1]|uniref:Uncharacterized protein n=1 Tax=Fictibacillus macauensis ZFHKF-1 TaxID=1196324 RepID=I8UGM0_9BACL|nr:hypothetical protein [Fictibacillus macauensis]EIT86025.1 hypothetical protein A374_06886 [Fictibacillus macauensis ZFHKF-1]